MTLALLITAVTGAWAQDVDGTIAWSVGNEASATVSASIKDAISSTGVTTGSGLSVSNTDYFDTDMVKYTPTTANAGNVEGVMIEYTIEAVDGYKFKPTGVDYAAVKVLTDNASYSWSYTIDGVESAITDVSKDDVLRNNGNNSGTAQLMHSESITADGCSVFTLRFYISNCGTSKNICIGNITISGSVSAAPEPAVDVTTDAAEEGATFTEASFQMPAYDATAEYELVRDMGYKVAFSGVPTRARLAKDDNGKFHFADGLTFQLLDNIDAANPKDITSAEGITFMVGEMEAVDFEGHTFYQLNKATLVPLADFLADAHLGNYAICAVASTGEYDGSFTSGTITLFQGYEVEVAAKEFITYYKDEPLYVEDEDAELYTIQSVSGDQAVLSDKSDAMPSNTPMLVYNKSNETKVILLIPCAEPDMAITVAPEFQGTLTATTIPASATGADNYALNGYAFVWVKTAIAVGANKCWLHIASQPAAARAMTRSIVGGNGTTGIDAIENVTIDNEGWYDLRGRKLQAKPNRGGIYIHNGKKVVIR